jgi:hypothetical protein
MPVPQSDRMLRTVAKFPSSSEKLIKPEAFRVDRIVQFGVSQNFSGKSVITQRPASKPMFLMRKS